MKILAFLVLALATASAYKTPVQSRDVPVDSEKEGRVMGGRQAKMGEIPWQVSIEINLWEQCSGSLISENWVLTSAQCFNTFKTGILHFGSISFYGKIRLPISSSNIIIHPGYNKKSSLNNIAVIKLDAPITFSEYIQPVQLPSRSGTYSTYVGNTAQVAGWGISSPISGYFMDLMIANIPIVTSDECTNHFPIATDDVFICGSTSHGQSSCEGDYGSPVTVDGVQVGIFAFDYTFGCHLGFPVVSTRVDAFRDWIYNTTGV